MTINKAVALAMLAGANIKRMDDPSGCEFKPTNTDDGIIIYGPNAMDPAKRWNPTADDLMSECWAVMVQTPDGDSRPWLG